MPQLDEAMADATLDILTDGPSAEPAPSAAEVQVWMRQPVVAKHTYCGPCILAGCAAQAVR